MTGYQERDDAQSTSESKSYNRLFSRVVIASLFTGVQLWALVAILSKVHADGVLTVALPVLAGGATAAVFLIWRDVRTLVHQLRQTVIDRRNEPIRQHRPERHLIAV